MCSDCAGVCPPGASRPDARRDVLCLTLPSAATGSERVRRTLYRLCQCFMFRYWCFHFNAIIPVTAKMLTMMKRRTVTVVHVTDVMLFLLQLSVSHALFVVYCCCLCLSVVLHTTHISLSLQPSLSLIIYNCITTSSLFITDQLVTPLLNCYCSFVKHVTYVAYLDPSLSPFG